MPDTAPGDENPDKEFPCLVRAVSGKKKLTTLVRSRRQLSVCYVTGILMPCSLTKQVQPADMDKFLTTYSAISRTHMDSLKKKERVRGAKKAKPAKTPKSI